jgi:hypothetical protein
MSWITIIPLFLLALATSTTGWILAARREASTTSVLDVASGLVAAGGALLIIGTGATGLAAAVIAVIAGAGSLWMLRVAASRAPSRD